LPWHEQWGDWLYPLGTIVFLVIAWELFVRLLKIPSYLVPRPYDVLLVLVDRHAEIFAHALVTAQEVALGYLLGVAVAVPCAILICWSRLLERSLMPLIVYTQTFPKSAIAPLFLIWFGYGILPKVVIAFLIGFFPMLIAMITGLRAVEPDAVDMIRSMSASKLQTFTKVRIPYSLPFFFSGAKVAATLSIVGALVGEFIGAEQGLGYLLIRANASLDTEFLFAILIPLVVLGRLFFSFVGLVERYVIGWHLAAREGAQGS
ncbi:MAG: ABC transporter permease, partial [Deltaproteobacteria bacterium]|nr:ABC transporter permease [Deltaproteobacteria bacterium]